MTTTDQAFEVAFGSRRLLLRCPKASEFDLALMGRLLRQLRDHQRDRYAVQPGPGAVLEIDRYDQLLVACMEELLGRVRTCTVTCATALDGKPCSREELEEVLGPVDDETLEDWAAVMGELLGKLAETARLGE